MKNKKSCGYMIFMFPAIMAFTAFAWIKIKFFTPENTAVITIQNPDKGFEELFPHFNKNIPVMELFSFLVWLFISILIISWFKG